MQHAHPVAPARQALCSHTLAEVARTTEQINALQQRPLHDRVTERRLAFLLAYHALLAAQLRVA